MSVILEGIVTSLNDDGTTNIAPMGPWVNENLSELVIRPFQSSRTYANLKRTARGVFHVTDDVEFLARAALNRWQTAPSLITHARYPRLILSEACRWYGFEIVGVEDTPPRARFVCTVQEAGRLRDFLGFNRAKHAVVEAAILATRVGILPDVHISTELERLQPLIGKTGGDQERRAFELVSTFVRERLILPAAPPEA